MNTKSSIILARKNLIGSSIIRIVSQNRWLQCEVNESLQVPADFLANLAAVNELYNRTLKPWFTESASIAGSYDIGSGVKQKLPEDLKVPRQPPPASPDPDDLPDFARWWINGVPMEDDSFKMLSKHGARNRLQSCQRRTGQLWKRSTDAREIRAIERCRCSELVLATRRWMGALKPGPRAL